LPAATLKVFLGCLLQANWKEKSWYDGTQQVPIPRGSFVTSYGEMSKVCKVSTKQVRTAWKHLENLSIMAYSRAGQWTKVTVLNYETYQIPTNDEGRVEGIERAGLRAGRGMGEGIVRAGGGQQLNKEKKVIREEDSLRSVPPPDSTPDLSDLAHSIHARHPRHRRPTLQATERALAQICMDTPDPLATAQGIDDRHAGWVCSAEWTREGGRYTHHLLKYLDPVNGLWMTEPPEAKEERTVFDELLAEIDERERGIQ
jgi:hypothetical protein